MCVNRLVTQALGSCSLLYTLSSKQVMGEKVKVQDRECKLREDLEKSKGRFSRERAT